MPGVQLIGKDAIIETFNDLGHETFAIYSGKTLIVCGTGVEDLITWIDRFCPPGVSGNFTLKLYDCELSEARAGADPAACFPCRVMDGYGGAMSGGFQGALSKRVEALEKGNKGEETENKFIDAIMGWLDEPEKLLQVVGAVKAFFSPAESAAAIPAGMGAVIPKEPQPGKLTPQQEAKYVELAGYLETLEKADPDIVAHLGKLANMSINEPGTFKMLLGMLKNK